MVELRWPVPPGIGEFSRVEALGLRLRTATRAGRLVNSCKSARSFAHFRAKSRPAAREHGGFSLSSCHPDAAARGTWPMKAGRPPQPPASPLLSSLSHPAQARKGQPHEAASLRWRDAQPSTGARELFRSVFIHGGIPCCNDQPLTVEGTWHPKVGRG